MTNPTTDDRCSFCRLPGAGLSCELCAQPVCRGCAIRLASDRFAFRESLPEELKKTRYCPRCHADQVEPAMEKYDQTLELAKETFFWPKSYRGQIPILKSARVEVSVQGVRDKEEAVLRLAFRAAELGFNAVMGVEIKGRKVRENNYQKTLWEARGKPIQVDPEEVDRRSQKFDF